MANRGRRDVDLVISAKNQASKAIDAVTSALADLTKAQASAGRGADTTSSLLSQLGTELGKLTQQVQGASAIERLASSMTKAQEAVERLERSSASAAQNQQALSAELQKSEAALAGYEARATALANTLTQQKNATAQARAEQSAFNKELQAAQRNQQSAASAYERAGAAFEKQAAKLTEIGKAQNAAVDAFNKADNPTRAQESAVTRLTTAYDKAKAKLDQLAASYVDLAGKSDEADAALESLQSRAGAVAANLDKARAAQAATASELKQTQEQASAAAANLTRLQAASQAAARAAQQEADALEKARAEMAQVAEATGQADAALGKISSTVRQQLLRALADGNAALAEFKKQQQDATSAVGSATRVGQFLRSTNAPQDQIDANDQQVQASIASARAAKQAFTEVQQAVQVLRNAIRQAGTDIGSLDELFNADTEAARRFQAALGTVSSAGRQAAEAASATVSATSADAQAKARQAASAAQAAASSRQAASAIRDTGNASGEAADKTGTFANTIDLLNSNSRQALSYTQRLRGEVLSLATSYVGVYSAIQQLKDVTQTFNQVQGVQTQLAVAFGNDTKQVGSEIAFLHSQAERLGVSFVDLSTEYAKFAVAVQQSPQLAGRARELFVPFAEAARVLNLTTADVNGVLTAITQMVSKGSVSLEELRQQLGDRLVGAFELLAKGLGLTTQELLKLISTGNLATADALPKLAEQLTKTFGPALPQAVNSLNAELGRFQTTIADAQLQIANGGFTEGLQEALRTLNSYFKSDDGKKFFQEIGSAAGTALKVLAQVPKYFDDIVAVLSVLVGIKASRFLQALATDFLSVLASTRQLPAVLSASNAAMAASTAEAGALRGAVTVLSTSYFSIRSSIAAASASLLASIRNFSLAEAAAGALTLGLGVLRAALAALGGIPGLVITGVTLILGQWLTSTNEATTALEAHEKQINNVRKAYNDANGAVQDWAKSIRDTSAFEIKLNTKDLQRQLADLRSNSALNPLGDAFGTDTRGTVKQINDVMKAFREGRTSAAEFKAAVEAIAEADPKLNENIVRALLNVANQAAKAEDAIKQNDAALRVIAGTATDADKALLGLNDTQQTQTKTTVDLTDKLNQLKELIPSLRQEMEKVKALGQIDLIQKQVDLSGIDKASQAYRDFIALAQRARDEINKRFDTEQFKDVTKALTSLGNGQQLSAALLKQFEGFQPVAKFDVNAFRAGFGSDTVTLADGTIQKITEGMRVSVEDANRDLVRRIGEFQTIVKGQIGTDRFNAFTPQQQAALTSIAYNYGSLPDRILDAVRKGSAQEIATAIRGLQGDNKGINANRRQAEAFIFENNGGVDPQELATLADKQLQTAQKYHQELAAQLELQQSQNAVVKDRTLQETVNAALLKAQNDAQAAGTTLSAEEVQRIKDVTTQLYNQRHAMDDINAAREREREMERQLNALLEQRNALMTLVTFAQNQGDQGAAEKYQQQLNATNDQLKQLVASQTAYWQAAGGPDADKALAKLAQVQAQLTKVQKSYLPTAQQLNEAVAEGLGGTAIDNFISKLQDGEDAVTALKDAFLQFAADFLKRIAEMILQQAILNALQSVGFGKGLAGFLGSPASAAAAVAHTGGIIGGSGLPSRSAPAAWFANAMRYHTGGIAGLAPNEVPAILQKGEEVLTRDDPRHIANSGGNPPAANVKIVNTIDSGGFVSAGMNTAVGQRAVLNFIQANQSSVKKALGVK